ncbi:MAG: hypothetical protein BRD40_03755 [Bacteroidetes bacterium QS_1_65_9]|nr:MAG: hypothetical protein BRD40_03755 [Bacteroidetes bacterium QS_1_65_9]
MNTTPSLRTLPVAAVLLAAALAFAPHDARAQFGVAGGANFDDFGDVKNSNEDNITENATGYHVGLTYEFGAGPLLVRPGVFYMDAGSFEFTRSDDVGGAVGEGQEARSTFDLNLVEVPIDLRLSIAPLPLVKPYVTAGPVLRIPTNDGSDEFPGSTEDLSLAANVGGGVEAGLPGSQIRFYPELRYSFGVNDIASDYGFQGEDDSSRLNNFMLRLGISF